MPKRLFWIWLGICWIFPSSTMPIVSADCANIDCCTDMICDPSVVRYGISSAHPTLDDFWDGHAEWVMTRADVGLPIGESDTVLLANGVYRSYLHASFQSAGVIDSCGEPVAFPGCLTIWESRGGEQFALTSRVCQIPCGQCPCSDQRDHHGYTIHNTRAAAQQYPRVAYDGEMWYMAYEWHSQVILRRSADGLAWSDWRYLVVPGGTYPSSLSACSPTERIGAHPHIRGQLEDCLVGAPPGIYVDGDLLYVFVASGSAPSHMRCYVGDKYADLGAMRQCNTDPLFSGAQTYGDVTLFGADANPYFDFRYISSAEVIKVGERYYMFYEGIRGPSQLEFGRDNQFGLGLARSVGNTIDGEWEKFPNNPILGDMRDDWGVGHADVLVINGQTVMYTSTSQTTRGKYVLQWK